MEDSIGGTAKGKDSSALSGVEVDGMIQDGEFVNLGDLHSFDASQYDVYNLESENTSEGYAEVRLDHSTLSEIRTRTWGRV